MMTELKRVSLETERLILRGFTEEDGPRVYELAKDERVPATTTLPSPYELHHATQWLASHEDRRKNGMELQFAICKKESQELIGCISYIFGSNKTRADIGYWVGVPYWGKGYCTEAVKKLIDYAFKELNLVKICAHHMGNNPSSGRVMQKAGMTQVGHFKKHIQKNNQLQDAIFYEVLR